MGKVGTGLLKLATLGGYGIWWLVDLLLILFGAQRDKSGLRLAGFAQRKKAVWSTVGGFLAFVVTTDLVAALMILGLGIDTWMAFVLACSGTLVAALACAGAIYLARSRR